MCLLFMVKTMTKMLHGKKPIAKQIIEAIKMANRMRKESPK